MKLHIVLYQPAIIQNVGNIARTCHAFNCTLHMIKPYGFIFNQSKLNRSSTNHFDLINLKQYDNWEEFNNLNHKDSIYYFFSRYGNKMPNEINVQELINSNKNINIYLVFGNEQTGIDKTLLQENKNQVIRIPMNKDLICINVSNSVAIACYEIYRQINFEKLWKEGK